MAHYVRIPHEKGAHYLNIDQVRLIEDQPDEQSVRVEFDNDHRVYFDRVGAQELLDAMGAKED